ncbi:tetratricopeptide repeat protein [Fibrobacterota bacterium]
MKEQIRENKFCSTTIILLFTATLLVSCSGFKDKSKVIAKVGNVKITEAEFNESFKSRFKFSKPDKANRKKKIQHMEKLVEEKLLRLAAQDEGLMKEKDLTLRMKSMEKRVLQRLYQEIFLEENGGFPLKDLQKYYRSNKNKFKNDSNVVVAFEKAKENVVLEYILEKADLDSFYIANKKKYLKAQGQDTVLPPLSENYETVSKQYVQQYKKNLMDNLSKHLIDKYDAEFITPEPKIEGKELYYQKNNKKYVTKETYEIFHLEMDSEDQIEERMSGVQNLEDFKQTAKQFSLNTWTKDAGGKVGMVKKTHCLPYGIGMFPKLFPILDSLAGTAAAFKRSVPLENPQTNRWHAFVLINKQEAKIKPLDRVKALVRQDLLREKGVSIPEDAVLAKYDKGKVIREKDVLFLRKEIPARYQHRYTREQLVKYLVTWDLADKEAKSLGLTKLIRVKTALTQENDRFWKKAYEDSIMKNTYGVDTATLMQVLNKNKAVFFQDTNKVKYSERLNRDILTFMAMEPQEFELEYAIHPEKYMGDSARIAFHQARFKIFKNLKRIYQGRPRENMIAKLKEKHRVKILDPLYEEEKLTDPQESFKLAQSLHTDRKLDEALNQYNKIRSTFDGKEYNGLQDSVCMGMAQVYVEQEKYRDALAEYRRILYLFPQSPNNYKAQFMIGFIYAENLKKDDLAIEAFKELLAKYPECDLADDADWMLRNIESGGALMPVLEDG